MVAYKIGRLGKDKMKNYELHENGIGKHNVSKKKREDVVDKNGMSESETKIGSKLKLMKLRMRRTRIENGKTG